MATPSHWRKGLNPGTEIAVDLPEDATDGALVQTVSAAAN